MREIPIDELRPGMVLPLALHNARGDLLLSANLPLSERHVDYLVHLGYSTVFGVEQGRQVTLRDVVSDRVREHASVRLARIFDAIAGVLAPWREGPLDTVAEALQGGELAEALLAKVNRARLEHDLEDVVEGLVNAEILVGMNAVRAAAASPLVRVLDAAAVSVALGRRLDYQGDALRRLATGALLKDVGMLLIDPDELWYRPRLGADAQARVRLHPTLGYQLLRVLRPHALLPNHVAFQHHERQDGTGYPRGLRGTNRVGRRLDDRHDLASYPPSLPRADRSGHWYDDRREAASYPSGTNRVRRRPDDRPSTVPIALDAEIVSVADVYVALSSGRGYREPLAPGRVVRTLQRLAGRALNRQVVAQLVAILPIYPLGSSVVVTSGRYAGCRGIVNRVRRDAPDQPSVRVLYDSDRRRIKPFELDVGKSGDTLAAAALPRPDERGDSYVRVQRDHRLGITPLHALPPTAPLDAARPSGPTPLDLRTRSAQSIPGATSSRHARAAVQLALASIALRQHEARALTGP